MGLKVTGTTLCPGPGKEPRQGCSSKDTQATVGSVPPPGQSLTEPPVSRGEQTQPPAPAEARPGRSGCQATPGPFPKAPSVRQPSFPHRATSALCSPGPVCSSRVPELYKVHQHGSVS